MGPGDGRALRAGVRLLTAPRLQPLTRARVASLGDAGAAWAARLPRLLEEVCAQWGLVPGRPLPGGSASYVVAAAAADGSPRVVKLVLPGTGAAAEAAVLREAAGRGQVLCHAWDADRRALLLERLGPSLEQTPGPPEEKVRLLAAAVRDARLPLPPAWSRPGPGEDRASELVRGVVSRWEALGGPAPARVLAAAVRAGEELAAAHDPAADVLAHGDPHPGNLLRVLSPRPGAPTGWALVDPEGVVADPAYDVGVALRDLTSALGDDPREARRRLRGWCALAAEVSGTDAEAVWRWALLERVSTGLYVTAFGGVAVGRRLLDSAALLV